MEKKLEIVKNYTLENGKNTELRLSLVGVELSEKQINDILNIFQEKSSTTPKKDLVVPVIKKINTSEIKNIKPTILETKKLPKLKHFVCCDKVGITTDEIAKCRVCGKEQKFDENIILDVICPECGKNIIALTNQKDMKFFMCGDCKTHIDVEYDHKTNKIKDLLHF